MTISVSEKEIYSTKNLRHGPTLNVDTPLDSGLYNILYGEYGEAIIRWGLGPVLVINIDPDGRFKNYKEKIINFHVEVISPDKNLRSLGLYLSTFFKTALKQSQRLRKNA